MRLGRDPIDQALKEALLKAALRIAACGLLPALLVVLAAVPAAARDDDHQAVPWGSGNGPREADEVEELLDGRHSEAPPSPDRRVDLRWIDRLNAYSADSRSHIPGVLPILPRLGAGREPGPPGWPRVPAEFEPQEALVLPMGLLAEEDPETLAGLVAGARRRTAVVGIVAGAAERARVEAILRSKGVPTANIQFAEIAHNTKWVRDYGPIFVWTDETHRAAVDAEYPEVGRDADDIVPDKLAGRFHAKVLSAPIIFEGGNLLSNGQGLCVTTTSAIFRNSDREDAEFRVCQFFRDCFGSQQTVFLEPLVGEQTGHVDMFACFAAPDLVLVGSYSPMEDALNAALLDRNAARLLGLSTPRGPLRVVRIPMPPHQDGVWRTYTNVVFANSVVLVPVYRGVDPTGREKALETFARLMPGWKVIGVESSSLIQGGGALRCVSAAVPLVAPRTALPLSGPAPERAPGNSRTDPRRSRQSPVGRAG